MTAYKISDEEFIKIVNDSVNIRDALQSMSLTTQGNASFGAENCWLISRHFAPRYLI